MKYGLLSEALLEYSEAIEFYAEQSPDLGQAFINAIENSIYRIREFPNRWGILEGEGSPMSGQEVSLQRPL